MQNILTLSTMRCGPQAMTPMNLPAPSEISSKRPANLKVNEIVGNFGEDETYNRNQDDKIQI